MRGHGTLQRLLGKRVGAKPQKGEEQPTSKRHNATSAQGRDSAGTLQQKQQKLTSLFKSQAGAGSAVGPDAALIPCSAAVAAPAFLVYTRVVGTRHQSPDQPAFSAQQQVQLVREPDNAVDPCAILVCCRQPSGRLHPYGHLPASVSAHLAGLLDSHAIEVAVQQALAAAASSDSNDHQSSDTAADMEAAAPALAPAAACSSRAASSRAASSRAASSRAASSSHPHHSSDDNDSPRAGSSSKQLQAWQIKLTITLTATGQQASLREVAGAINSAAAAGLESLEPGKNNGAVLAASFDHILQQTWVHDLHLLDEQEQTVLQHIQSLPSPARALLLRLLLRKPRWFQLSGMSYPEVPDAPAAAQQLASAGLLVWSHDNDADLDSMLPELPVFVLKQVLAALLPRNHPAVASATSAGSHKEALLASIRAGASRARLQAAIGATGGVWLNLRPAVVDAFSRMQRLYFISPGQDLGMFVAVDRGALRYPSYSIRRTSAVFPSRGALLDYEQALQLAAQVEAALEEGNHNAAWQLVQPALEALRAGAHKEIWWDEFHGPMPNPPLAAAWAAQHLRQQHVQTWPEQRQQVEQLIAAQQHIQLLDEQQEEHAQPDSPLPRQVSRSPSPRCPFSPGMMIGVKGRSRSRTPSPSSNTPGSSSDDSDSESSSHSSTSHSRASASSTSLGSRSQSTSSSTTSSTQPCPVQVVQAVPVADQAILTAVQAAPAASASVGPQAVAQPSAGVAAGMAQPLFLARFCAGWVHASLGTVAVSLLERQKRWAEAVDVLRLLLGGNGCLSRRGDWWTRLAINLEHQGLPEQALEAVEASLADSWVRGGDLLGLQRRLLRLGRPPRRWKRHPWALQAEWEPPEVVIIGRPLNCTTGTKSRFYGPDDSQVGVEELVLQHYASEEGGSWQGLHTEGGVWATLFGLLLWDELFMDVPDVFRSPFQVGPLDLDCDTFYPARRARIDKQLSRIADGQAGEILSASWERHVGVLCRGVNWSRFTQQQLLDICECVGGLGLAAVLRLMAEDHSGAQGGLPDLLLWRLADRSAKVVEVKGPRDRLSNQQRFWLAHMANSTFQVEVCKVKEPPAASKGSSRNK